MVLLHFLRLIRLPNLIMAVLGLFTHWYFLMYKPFVIQGTEMVLSIWPLIFLALIILGVMAAGYIINDIRDIQTDTISKPDKVIVGKYISKSDAYRCYYIIVFISLILAVFLANKLKFPALVLVIFLILLTLHFYASYFKKTFFWGNMIVSFLCVLVIALPYWIELYKNSTAFKPELSIGPKIYYSCFIAGLLSFIRELIKDQEDIVGDKSVEALTIPIVLGLKRAKSISILLLVITIISLIIGIIYFQFPFGKLIVIFLAVLLPCLLVFFNQLFSKKDDYKEWSTYYKIIMVSGMLVLPWALSNLRS